MTVTEAGRTTEVRAVFRNAYLPMDFRPSSKMTSEREVQPSKAEKPRKVTEEGISILVRAVQFLKAELLIRGMPS